MLTNQDSDKFLEEFSAKLENLADIINVNKRLQMSKETSLLLIEYRLKCEREAELYPEHEEIKKAEISHRYFKALKLAGAYAFIDDSPELTQDHLYQAIKLAEESSRKGWIDLKRVGEIIEIGFPKLISQDELELLHE